jgi:hypothetical protein
MLSPGKEVRVDYGGRSTGSWARIGNSLGRKQRGAIKKAIGILALDICENLSFPGIEIAFWRV